MRRLSHCRPETAAERGTAYLFVLLTLLVLTVVGLSLVVITQTEVHIGGAHKSANRVLYGADAGMRVQFAMQRRNLHQNTILLETSASSGMPLLERVDMSPFTLIYSGPCALCTINMGGDSMSAGNYVVNAQARRLRNISDPCSEAPQASKLVSQMFFIQPDLDSSQSGVTGSTGPGLPIRGNPTEISGGSTCVDGLNSASIVY
jgi:hypothetical protein